MLAKRIERIEGACVVHLEGTLEKSDDLAELFVDIAREIGPAPLVLDLSALHLSGGGGIPPFLVELSRSTLRDRVVLAHRDLETRRTVRAMARGVPVVPCDDLALLGRHVSAVLAHRSEATV